MPKVSVVIPSYNHAAYLKACVDSALQQTLSDLEVIVVDDCGTDGSLEVAKSIEDPRLHVHQNLQNLGTYGTLNAAIGYSTGEFIAVLDSDDLWAPDKLEKQVRALEGPHAVWSYCLGNRIDEDGEALPSREADIPISAGTLAGLLYQNMILASSLVFRRDAVTFDETARYSGDWIALLHLAANSPAARVEEPLAFWRQHEANSYVRSPAQTAEEIRLRQSILANFRGWKSLIAEESDRKLASQNLSENAMALAALQILVGDRHGAVMSALFAHRLSPSRRTFKRLLAAQLPERVSRQRLWGQKERFAIDYVSTRPLFELPGASEPS